MNRLAKFLVVAVLLCTVGCSLNTTLKVQYPPASELFVTSGDDPGTESPKPYVPKGQYIHVAKEFYLPIPVLGMFLKLGNADPQVVFDRYIIPGVREMGGNGLTNANVNFTPPSAILWGLIGIRRGGLTVVVGQAVKK